MDLGDELIMYLIYVTKYLIAHLCNMATGKKVGVVWTNTCY